MTENEPTVFRKKALERMSSPEQLTDYLCVTNPGIWVLLAAVILLLGALFAWSAIGTLDLGLRQGDRGRACGAGGDQGRRGTG